MRRSILSAAGALVILAIAAPAANGDAWDEFCAWRRMAGLPQLAEDPSMTAFAMHKARYRAERGLRRGHAGPRLRAGWHEGTAEWRPSMGFGACYREHDFRYGGAGMCVGRDGRRYMVLVVRGGSGRSLMRRSRPTFNTAHLTPNPPRVGQVAQAGACPNCGRYH